MGRLQRCAALGATWLILGACAPSADHGNGAAPVNRTPVTLVQVDSRHDHDVVVYLVRSGARHRLGNVGPLSSRTFAIPPPVLLMRRTVHLLLDPFASGDPTYVTEAVSVTPGEQIRLKIGYPLALSSVAVR